MSNLKAKGGQPTKYKKEYDQLIVESGQRGEQIVEFCASIGIHKDTHYEWIKVHPSYSDAVKRSRTISESQHIKVMRMGMVGKIDGFNATMAIFMGKLFYHWREDDKVDMDNITGIDFLATKASQ